MAHLNSAVDRLIGTKLRARREQLGVTRQQLGDALGLSARQIECYENGEDRVHAGRLFEFARHLAVPLSYFFHSQDADAASSGAAGDEQDRTASAAILMRLGDGELLRLFESSDGFADDGELERLLALLRDTAGEA